MSKYRVEIHLPVKGHKEPWIVHRDYQGRDLTFAKAIARATAEIEASGYQAEVAGAREIKRKPRKAAS